MSERANAGDKPAGNAVAPPPAKDGDARSRRRGDAPQAVLERYLIEHDRLGRPSRFYRDHRATEPMFRDEGRRLIATQAYPDAVADMLKIAKHRGWTEVRLSGDERFRREAWIQAQTLGLAVRGYSPRDRDRQAAGDRSASTSAPDRRPFDAPMAEDRLRAAAAVVRRLIEDPAARIRLMTRAMDRLRDRTGIDNERGRQANRGSRDRRP
ncbi:LPD7 domain-containing protein [Brevundimonas sp.]|jgi:hypothetical protein|uniref:LPD7 domain-containing protein n=1 Tax=Brevundimonas sp. TaxID=1871086 RepID=UPI0037C0CC4B